MHHISHVSSNLIFDHLVGTFFRLSHNKDALVVSVDGYAFAFGHLLDFLDLISLCIPENDIFSC